jgi:protein phosphatase
LQAEVITAPRLITTQLVSCQSEGEAVSVSCKFAFGDTTRSLRLWAISRDKTPVVRGLLRQVLEEYMPWEQGLATILEDSKKLSQEHGVGMLVGDKSSLFVLLPPGYALHTFSGGAARLTKTSRDKYLYLKFARLQPDRDFRLIISSEPVDLGDGTISGLFPSDKAVRSATIRETADRLSTGGPLGILSVTPERTDESDPTSATMAYVQSNRGLVREGNEDSAGVASVSYASEGNVRRFTIGAVADGVGGLESGELASKIGVATGVGHVAYEMLADESEDYATALTGAFNTANEKIVRLAAYGNKSMGSTLCMTLLMKGKAYLASAGDTREYLVRTGNHTITRMTTDHRLEQEGARSHVITRALGSREHSPDILGPFELQNGDILLTCTDGLHDLVTDNEILEAATRNANPKLTSSDLIALANQRGGKDNITVGTLVWRTRLDSLGGEKRHDEIGAPSGVVAQ